MGYNTAVLVLNDAVHQLKDDPGFGTRLHSAIMGLSLPEHVRARDVSIGYHVNGCRAIATQHADVTQIVAIGGNYATVLANVANGGVHHTDEAKEYLLRQLAAEMGYDLRRKPSKRKA